MTGDIRPPAACPVGEDLKACIDGELGLVRRAVVERHLRECAVCREELEAMKAIGEEVVKLGEVAPPAGLRDRVLARLDFSPASARPADRFQLLQWGSQVALVCVVVGMIAALLFPVFATSRESARRASQMAQDRAMQRRPAPAGAPYAGGAPGAPAAGGAAPQSQFDLARENAPVAGGGMPGGMPGRRNGSPYTAGHQKMAQAEMPTGARAASPSLLPRMDQAAGVTPDDISKYTRGSAIEDVERKVVQTADLSVRVNRNLESAQDDVARRLKKDGGYVERSALSSAEGGERIAEMALRVPVEKFEEWLTYLGEMGDVTAKNVHGEDVTGTWIDQRADVRELRKEEERLSKQYRNAKTAAAREEARYALLDLRPRIAASEERFALTGKLAALATVRLKLTEEPQARVRGNLLHDLDNTTRSALAAFLVAIRVPAALLIWLAVFSPLWLPCLLVYRWASRMARSQRPDPVPPAFDSRPAPGTEAAA
jgi:hypothetical protein